MEMANERESKVKEIQHPFHEHPLVFVEESNELAYCYGCGESVLSAPCFSCVHCNYHLHKECAEAPDEIPNHPLHPKHAPCYLVSRERPSADYRVYGCALCKEKRNMFFYICSVYYCNFSLDIKCAKLSSSFKLIQESKPYIHRHPLALIEGPMDQLKKLYCSRCLEPPVNDHIYICLDCPLVLHSKCLVELPTKIHHPSHHQHPLILNYSNSVRFCKVCQDEHFGPFYRCSLCPFDIDIECAWEPRSIVEEKCHHQHPFNLFWRQGSFTCDACDTEGNYIYYICLTCSITVHKECTSLPCIIKHSRHDHCIFHKYFLETQELTRKDCKLCFKEVRLERGSYSCVKPGCNYVVHVRCTLQHDRFYDVIDDEKQCEERYGNMAKSLQPSITRVIEENEDGEATKIEHFSHQHCLVLADDKKMSSDGKCDGCMLSLSSTLFYYYCSECPFFLHKTCAELPQNKPHWFNKDRNVTLESIDFMRCFFCIRLCSGFFYKIRGGWKVCLRCAKVGDIIEECQGHQHFLFFDPKCREECNACGVSPFYYYYPGAFRCGKNCNFTLHFACLTLPHSAHHKFDEHVLKLTYHDDDKEQCYCDICEKERDPSLWYYHCSICDNSAHTKCVLGDFPFLKDGITWPSYMKRHGHPRSHDLVFFRKAEGYPECSVCGRLCQEEFLKCAKSTCNYIIHYKCC